MLQNLEQSGALQARILKTGIALVQAAQDLKEFLETKGAGSKSFDKNKYREHLNMLCDKEVPLPWEMACGVLTIEAMDALKGLCETKDSGEVQRLADLFADMIGPNVEL